ncbi:MAG: acetyl-CoA carboxylase biotin carboxyl carrier protein [Bacteroidia bacterium]
MNKKEIEELIKFVAKAGVSEVNLELKDFKITIKNSSPKVEQIYHAAPAPVMTMAPAPVAIAPAVAAPSAPSAAAAPATDESTYITIKSPMIGTFYRASGPDKPILANVGDEIKPGKVLCIIEAMKLFNEIESEVSGRIVKVLVDNLKPVEYDTPLFLVDPS